MKGAIKNRFNEEETIYIDYTDENDEVLQTVPVKIRTSIFQPSSMQKSWFRTKVKKLGEWLIDMTTPHQNRFIRLHKILKPYILYPAFKLIKKIIGKQVIKDDTEIVGQWYNNHIRIFRHCFYESADDIYRILVHNQKCTNMKGKKLKEYKELNPTGQIMLDNYNKKWLNLKGLNSLNVRKLACDIWVTSMLEDTADREWCNSFMLRSAIEVGAMYGIPWEELKKIPLPGQYPVFTSKKAYMPEYFMNNARAPVWVHPNRREEVIKKQKQMEEELKRMKNGKDKDKKS